MPIVTTAYPVAPSVTKRQKIERAIVSRAVTALLSAGYWLAVCQGDEDEQPPKPIQAQYHEAARRVRRRPHHRIQPRQGPRRLGVSRLWKRSGRDGYHGLHREPRPAASAGSRLRRNARLNAHNQGNQNNDPRPPPSTILPACPAADHRHRRHHRPRCAMKDLAIHAIGGFALALLFYVLCLIA
jgi:hypothetical protein